MSRLFAIWLVALSVVWRTVAALHALQSSAADVWLLVGFMCLSGGLSLALLGLAMRAVLGFGSPPRNRPAPS